MPRSRVLGYWSIAVALWIGGRASASDGFPVAPPNELPQEAVWVAQAPAPALPPLPSSSVPTARTPVTTPPTPFAASISSPAPPMPAPVGPGAAALFGEASGLTSGGGLSLFTTPEMFGDRPPLTRLLPISAFQTPGLPQPPGPPSPGPPPVPGRPGPSEGNIRHVGGVLLPWVRGFKIADNQSPRPQDRVFVNFNYFDNVNASINRRLGNDVRDLQIYRGLFGFEKTFFDGKASIGLRLPVNSLSADSQLPGLGGTSVGFGDLTVFTKAVIIEDRDSGSLISGGLAVTTPSGPASFAGAGRVVNFHSTTLQPYLGFILGMDRWYLHGFTAVDVPTISRDVTIYYNDLGVGYFLYRAADPKRFLSAVVPTFEVHVNTPLNHRGGFSRTDPAWTPDVVDFTYGTSFNFSSRARLSVGYVSPVTGPRPFAGELLAFLNFYF